MTQFSPASAIALVCTLANYFFRSPWDYTLMSNDAINQGMIDSPRKEHKEVRNPYLVLKCLNKMNAAMTVVSSS
jgi:hypothetical protein